MSAWLYHATFDLAIAAVLAGVPLLLFWLRSRPEHLRGTGVLAHIAPLLVFGWLVVFYGSFVEPNLLVTREYAVHVGDGSRMLRIAVVSDTHLGYHHHEAWLRRVVHATNAVEPDLVLLAGDFVSNAAGMEQLAPLRDLRSEYGTFAVLGNWDYRVGAVDVRHAIERYGVEVLTNESIVLEVDGEPLRLIGLDDLWYGAPDWDAALTERKEGEATVLLAHEPDFVRAAEVHNIDLVVAGHTHGGQIRLPFIGPVGPLPTTLGRSFDQGLFSVGPTTLFITPGVGTSGTRARLFAPPEISLLTITF